MLKSLNILGKVYTVEYVPTHDLLLWESEAGPHVGFFALAKVSFSRQLIWVSDGIHPEGKFEAILHEVIHALDSSLRLGMCEELVHCLATALSSVVGENPGLMRPYRVTGVPTRSPLYILGKTYEVKYVDSRDPKLWYEKTDDGDSGRFLKGMVIYDDQKIYISKGLHVDHEFEVFLGAVILALDHVLSLGMNGDQRHRLATGLTSVVFENDEVFHLKGDNDEHPS